MFEPEWDIVSYLCGFQLLLLWGMGGARTGTPASSPMPRGDLVLFGLPLVLFWLVWGGYPLDAWNYLTAVDQNPLNTYPEKIFWIAMLGLNALVPHPWSLKLVSAFTAATLIYAYYLYLGNRSRQVLLLSYLLLLALPGFFLLTGNAVKQGVAGALAVLGTVWFLNGRLRWSVLLSIVCLFIHQFSVLWFIAVFTLRHLKRYLIFLWILSPFVSYIAAFGFELTGHNLADIVRYASYSEGVFHWGKFLITSILVAMMFVSLHLAPARDIDFRHIYIALVAISNTILMFEVPFERMLLFSDLVLPLAIVTAYKSHPALEKHKLVLLIPCITLPWALWTHSSIMRALGYV